MKVTKKTINPGFILLCINLVLMISLCFSLISSAMMRTELTSCYAEISTLREDIKEANRAEEIAVQELEDFKAEYYTVSYEVETLELEPEVDPEPVTILATEPEMETVLEDPDQILTVQVTAYCTCPICCGTWSKDHPSRQGTDYVQYTASGTIPTAGRTLSVDPTVIPLGSKVVIDGHDYVAEDTGSAVIGNHIDMYFASHEEALEWGVKTMEVSIYEE